MKCPICEGEGRWIEFVDYEGPSSYTPCNACNGIGEVSLRWMISHWFWNTVPVCFVEWYADVVLKVKEDI